VESESQEKHASSAAGPLSALYSHGGQSNGEYASTQNARPRKSLERQKEGKATTVRPVQSN
jgi:hypothetical protein